MRALDRKLRRDLWRLRGQVVAIGLVLASGVGLLIMSLSAIEALEETAAAYYERYRFAEVFASVKRAPERLAQRLAQIPGVQAVQTRIVELAVLDVAGFDEPVVGRLVSVPERGEPVLNRLVIRSGRNVEPGRPDEVVVGEPFAMEHGLGPGDRIGAIVNGHRRRLEIVGTALSPEFVYAIGPGALMPDDTHYGILWMGREALAAAYDLDEAFNDVSLSLLRGADPADVIDRVDRILEPYGGVGAYERADQGSHWFVNNEIQQLKTMSGILPTIFLAVAAFLSNMVLARLVTTERAEIGLLKAFGYGNLAVAWHYVKLVGAMSSAGILLGWMAGFWLGRFNTEIYADLFHFPFLYFRPSPSVFASAAIVSLAAALIGTLGAVHRAATLSPATAMAPLAPPLYRRGRVGASSLDRWLDQPTRIFLRQILRWPARSFLTSAGIAMSVAVLVIALHWLDAIEHMVEVQFFKAQRQDATIGFVEVQSSEVQRGIERLPGVLATEPVRTVAARLHAGSRSRREAIQGVDAHARLQPVYDVGGREVDVAPGGLVLSTELARILRVERGDLVTVEVLEGRQPTFQAPVVETFETYIGTPAYMRMDTLNRMMRERPSVNAVHVLVDERHEPEFLETLKEIPVVSAVTLRRAAVDMFHETMGETVLIFVSFFVVFSCTLAFGVVYNSARIALSERGRELATLRVIGFGRVEISYILLGETALLTFVALPLGCLFGHALALLVTGSMQTELFRIPLVIEASTYGAAVLVGLLATMGSAIIVRRRLDRLDLIAVLKTRE